MKGRGKTGGNCKFEFVFCNADRSRKTDIETETSKCQRAGREIDRQIDKKEK